MKTCDKCPSFLFAADSIESGRCTGCRAAAPTQRVSGCHTFDPYTVPRPSPVTNKADCYRRMVAGEFGNTLPRWFDYDKWLQEAFHTLPL